MKNLPITVFAISLAAAMTASAQVTVTTEETMAPNAFGSPNYVTWEANGIYAAENSLSSYGAAGPAQFNVAPVSLPVAANFVTGGFYSWMGQADPAAPYDNELGNRASFVTVINGNGSLIDLNNVGFTMSSSDPGNALGYSFPPGSFPYSAPALYGVATIGLVFSNGLNIAGGFTVVDSGDPGQAVNEIISIGVGNAYASYSYADGGDDPNPSDTDQQVLNYDIAQAPSSYDFTGTFTYGSASGSATVAFVPEPGTEAFVGMGLMGLLLVVRRRKA